MGNNVTFYQLNQFTLFGSFGQIEVIYYTLYYLVTFDEIVVDMYPEAWFL